ncbi:MAG TPA: S1/P1 nuclease [Fodinibius sp.]|nr:S1/P1 nuclease [Fodinibius sp.]
MFVSILLSLVLSISISSPTGSLPAWGKTGHRITGKIAADHLNKEAKKEIRRILGHESIAIASIWMDQIRSDPRYDYTHDWHWVTIPNGKTYEETEKNPNGDLIQALRRLIDELKQDKLSHTAEKRKLKMIIHLMGDLHQPLHVGTGNDRGGNDTNVEWFYEPSNLHRVWDSGMIDETKLSYTEFSRAINYATGDEIKKWSQGTILDWAYEARDLREEVYDLPKDRQLSYRYMYIHRPTLDLQLLKGGIRLAHVLNEIYG